MTPEQIKASAPYGATHYKTRDGYVSYYKVSHGCSFFWNIDSWAVTYIDIISFTKPL